MSGGAKKAGARYKMTAAQADDSMLWSASGGLMSQQFSFAEKVRQARQLDAVLEHFNTDDEDEEGSEDEGDLEAATERRFEASLSRTARHAAKAAVWPGSVSDAASEASTRLQSSSESCASLSTGSSSVPQSSGAGSVCSYASCQSSGTVYSQRSSVASRSHLSSVCSSPPSSSGSSACTGLPSPRRLPPLGRAPARLPPLPQPRPRGPLELALTGGDDEPYGGSRAEEGDEGCSEEHAGFSGSSSALRWRPSSGSR